MSHTALRHPHLQDGCIPPYGLAVIASAISRAGFNAAIIDADAQGFWDSVELVEAINSLHPRAVGLSISTPCYFQARKIAQHLNPDIGLLLGGPHPSALPLQTLCDFSSFSNPTVVVGPGEEAVCDILSDGSCELGCVATVDSVSEELCLSPAMPESIEPLAYEFQCLSKASTRDLTAFVLSSRGCPRRCSFCSIHTTSGEKVIINPPEAIVCEIENLLLRGVETIRFLDDLFVLSDNRMRAIRKCFAEAGLLGKVSWYANARVDIVRRLSQEGVRAMIESGCKGVGLGIESASDRILAEVGKGFKKTEALEAVKRLTESGLRVYCYFIVGFPGESYSEIVDTVSLAEDLQRYHNCRCGIVPYKLYPGTVDFNRLIGSEPSVAQIHALARFRPAKMTEDTDPPYIREALVRREGFTIFHDEAYFSPHSVDTERIESILRDFYRSRLIS